MISSQQHKLRHSVHAGPNDGVLFEPRPQRLGRLQGQPKTQVPGLTGVSVEWVLANAFNVCEAAMAKFSAQVGMSFGIGSVVNVFAKWVACRDEGAAIDAVAFVQGGDNRAGQTLPTFMVNGSSPCVSYSVSR